MSIDFQRPARHGGNPVFHLDAPHEHDGKAVVVVSPATEGTMTWITSRGDDPSPTPPATGRGDGAKIGMTFTQAEEKYVDFVFTQPVELHDGQVWYSPVADWTDDDEFSVSVIVPANSPTVNGTNTGNCNKVEIAEGSGMYVIVPAAGDGGHDIDLESASPSPMPFNTGGYWEVDWSDGTISASATPGQARWGLFDFSVESFFIKRVSMGNPLGIFDIDVYKAEYCHHSWTFRLRVNRVTTGAGTFKVGGWLMLFRRDST